MAIIFLRVLSFPRMSLIDLRALAAVAYFIPRVLGFLGLLKRRRFLVTRLPPFEPALGELNPNELLY